MEAHYARRAASARIKLLRGEQEKEEKLLSNVKIQISNHFNVETTCVFLKCFLGYIISEVCLLLFGNYNSLPFSTRKYAVYWILLS